MKILLATDAWLPQVNGVVRTLGILKSELEADGHLMEYVTPDRFRTIPCPTYPDIRLALGANRGFARVVDEFGPDAIHIATEGPVGMAARRVCLQRKLPFTSAYHTKFPEYLNARFRIPHAWVYALLRNFHAPSSGVMVATESIRKELAAHGFRNLRPWSRGVDTELFKPRAKGLLPDARPILLYVGRIAVEKNLRAFLDLDVPGTKYVVGDGPQLPELRRRYPDVRFAGAQFGEDLARYYAASDVFVFPSRTDTFGLVLLEALASGLPVAAYPVPGPLDVIGDAPVGCLDEDLGAAVRHALDIPAARCREHALRFTWQRTARQFLENLRPVRSPFEEPVGAAAG